MTTSEPLWRRLQTRLGLTPDLVKSVIKNALPPTAALWVIQSTTVGQHFDTVGYLPIIVTILMAPALPRMPYLRLLIFSLVLLCVLLCIALLAGYCITQARLHTTPRDGRLDAYNSSAAAVSGIWLIFTVWALQTFRTYNPHRAKSVILVTIFSEVSIVTTAQLSDMTAVISFNLQLFEMFLLGFAFSAFTSIFIFPQSSRDVTLVDVVKLLDLSQTAAATIASFGDDPSSDTPVKPEKATVAHIESLSRTFAKFQIDISDAKKDVGWSLFSPGDYKELVQLFRIFITPLRGIFAVESIRTTLPFGTDASQFDKDNALAEKDGVDPKERWETIFKTLREPMSQLHQLTEEAVNHCRIVLHLPGSHRINPQNSQTNSVVEDVDPEKISRELPGGVEFVRRFEQRAQQQRVTLKLALTSLKDQDGMFGSSEHLGDGTAAPLSPQPTASQGRFLFGLYIDHLYTGVLEALLELVLFCDRFSGLKPKLQWPGRKRMLKLIRRLTDHHHIEGDIDEVYSEIPDLTPQRSRLPDKPAKRSHALHLAQIDNFMDKIFAVIGSPQSFFGFRVACAVMTVAIVAYLEQTQQWFFNQRGLWAAVFIPFSMAPSSGEAKSMLVFRVLGTLCSIPLGIVNWYMVDGIPAGVIVFFFIFVLIQQYFLVRFPQWGSFWRPCVITYAIIMGYTLQAKHTTSPQPPATINQDYPVYLIGPYRGLCTLVGVAIAYFWTVFPQPTTANSVMRRRLGQALFVLAEYHSCMHWAISSWAGGHQGNVQDKKSVAHRLMKTRHKLFAKEAAILAVIRDQYKFAGYDLKLGGSYSEHRYVSIVDEVDRIMTYMNVVIFVSAYFQSYLHNLSRKSLGMGSWESGVDDLLIACRDTSRQVASLIHILASSVTNNQPLPPFLETPAAFGVAKTMRERRPDLMDLRNAGEEGYKAFGVIEVSVAMMTRSLDKILIIVRDMVGEVGFDASSFETE